MPGAFEVPLNASELHHEDHRETPSCRRSVGGGSFILRNTASQGAQRIEITAPRAAVAAAQSVLALRDFDTSYEMSSGRRMVVTSFGDAVRVSYGRRAPKILRHDGHGSFVSQDGQLALQFELDSSGEPQNVRLSLPANLL